MGDPMVAEKLEQVPAILKEMGIDLWMLWVRESAAIHDPSLDLVVGSNVTWSSAFLLTAAGDRIAVVGSLDKANLEMHGHYREVVPYVAGVTEDLRKVLARLDPGRIAVNYSLDDTTSDGLTHGMWLQLQKVLEGTPYASRLESAQPVIAALRGRKSSGERARIRRACQETDAIFDRLSARLRAGQTEKQIAGMILEEMSKVAGAEPAWDVEHCPAVFTGPDSAGAHAGPTGRAMQRGHVMNVDFGIRLDGYCSDLQRTWYVLREGETAAPPAVQKGFDTIVEAIRTSAEAVRPGVPGHEVDAVARGLITSRGYPEYPHALGHQIGRTAHDGAGGFFPRWERYGGLPELPVEAGQCFTIEPRLPIEGHGIATCEEIVAVDPAGCTWLSRPQRELFLVR